MQIGLHLSDYSPSMSTKPPIMKAAQSITPKIETPFTLLFIVAFEVKQENDYSQ